MGKISLGGNRFGLFVYSWRDWWFRLWGYGISTRPKAHRMLFSERTGRRKAVHTLGQCWQLLNPPDTINKKGK